MTTLIDCFRFKSIFTIALSEMLCVYGLKEREPVNLMLRHSIFEFVSIDQLGLASSNKLFILARTIFKER